MRRTSNTQFNFRPYSGIIAILSILFLFVAASAIVAAQTSIQAVITSHQGTVKISPDGSITLHGRSEPADAAKGYRWAVFRSGSLANLADVENFNSAARQAVNSAGLLQPIWFDRSPTLQFRRSGTYEIRFSVKNAQGEWSQPASIFVNVNAVPLFLSNAFNGQQAIPSSLLFRVNQPRTFTLTAFDADNDRITYELSGLPGARLDPTTGVFYWAPANNQAGRYDGIEIRASDSRGGSAIKRITVFVEASSIPSIEPLTARLQQPQAGSTTTIQQNSIITVAGQGSRPGDVTGFRTQVFRDSQLITQSFERTPSLQFPTAATYRVEFSVTETPIGIRDKDWATPVSFTVIVTPIPGTQPLAVRLTSHNAGDIIRKTVGYRTPPITFLEANNQPIAGKRVAVFIKTGEDSQGNPIFDFAPLGSVTNAREDQSLVNQARNTAGVLRPVWFDAEPVIQFNQPGYYELRMAVKGLDGTWSAPAIVTYIIGE